MQPNIVTATHIKKFRLRQLLHIPVLIPVQLVNILPTDLGNIQSFFPKRDKKKIKKKLSKHQIF